MARYAVEQYEVSERHACRLLNVSRTAYRYKPKRTDDSEIRVVLLEKTARWPPVGIRQALYSPPASGVQLEL